MQGLPARFRWFFIIIIDIYQLFCIFLNSNTNIQLQQTM